MTMKLIHGVCYLGVSCFVLQESRDNQIKIPFLHIVIIDCDQPLL